MNPQIFLLLLFLNVAARLFEQGLCLPSGSSLTAEEQARVVAVVRACLAGSSCSAKR